MISRFSKRLALFMSPEVSGQYFIDDIEAVTLTWFNAPSQPGDLGAAAMEENRTADAIDRCRKHYASPATIRRDDWSTEDEIVHASVDTVAHEICTTLFTVRRLLIDASPETRTDKEGAQLEHAVAQGRKLIGSLMDNLGWTTFKQAQPCAVDEILFIAMWPVGDEEDHWHPGCRSIDRIRETKETYWNIFRPRYDEVEARGDVSDFE